MRLPPARATFAIAAITGLAWLATMLAGQQERMVELAGFIPARWSGLPGPPGAAPAWLAPLSATLVHGGLWHILFNLLMIVFCGRLVEVSIGPIGLAVLYGVGGYAAAGAEFALHPHGLSPMIGASGAGSAVIGAYALLYGRRKAKSMGPFPATFVHIIWLAAAWIGLQILIGLSSGGLPGQAEGWSIAVGAHIGGFLAGLILARPLLLWRYRNA